MDIDLVRPEMPGQLTLLSGVGVAVHLFNERVFEKCSITPLRPSTDHSEDKITSAIDDLLRSGAQQTHPNRSVLGLAEIGRVDNVSTLAGDLITVLQRIQFLAAIRVVYVGRSIRQNAVDGTKLLDPSDYSSVRGEVISLSQDVLAKFQKLTLDPNRPSDDAIRRALALLFKVTSELQKDQPFDQTLYIPAYNDSPSGNHKAGEGTRFLSCTDSISGLTTLSERLEVRWRDPQRISVSGGVLVSSLGWRSYKNQQIGSGQTEIISDTNVPQVQPIFLFNYKIWNKVWWGRSINLDLSPGLVLNIHDTLRPEFMLGETLNIGNASFTVGPHFGNRLSLAGGVPLNVPLNITPGMSPATTCAWRVGVAVAVSYRLPIH